MKEMWTVGCQQVIFHNLDIFVYHRPNLDINPILGKSAITHSKVGQSSPNLSPFSIGYSCSTLWVENSLEIAPSLTVCEIFVIFHIFTKSSNKVAITHLYIEQQL